MKNLDEMIGDDINTLYLYLREAVRLPHITDNDYAYFKYVLTKVIKKVTNNEALKQNK